MERKDNVRFLRVWDSPTFKDSVTDDGLAGALTTTTKAYVIIERDKAQVPIHGVSARLSDRITPIGSIGKEDAYCAWVVYDSDGIAPTLTAGMGMGGGVTPFVVGRRHGSSD